MKTSAAPPIAVHVAPYGRPAVALLQQRIAEAKAGDPLQPVTVIVPTNYVGVSVRRLLARGELGPLSPRGRGIAGLHLLTVYRLAELLGAPALAGAGRRPVSTPVIAAAVRAVLGDDPGIFERVREHPATEEALVHAHRELSEVRPEGLRTLAATSRRAADVVRIHQAVRRRLSGAWFEEADLMEAAVAAVRAGTTVAHDLGVVLVHLPQRLSLPAATLLREVASVRPVEVIAAYTGADDADRDIDSSLRRLGAVPPSEPPAPATATRIISVSDPEEEVRSAVEQIVCAARRGIPLERMAVLYPAAEPYARVAHEQLEAARLPYNGRAVRPLSDRLAGRWLLDLLALPDSRYARPDVMGLLGSGRVVDGRRQWVPSSMWERVSREAGIVRGRAEWAARLRRHADDLRARADAEESYEEPREWLVARRRREAEQADALRAFVTELFQQIDRGQQTTTWQELAAWCRDMLARYLDRQDRWPDVERDAAERVDGALDRLAGLDAVESDTDLGVFRRTLQLELDDDLGRVGQFGRGVLVGTMSSALGVDLDLVVVLGLAEGVLPTQPREDSLLSDAERQVVADQLPPRRDRVGVEHRHLLAALAASSGERVLVYPRGDQRRSIERAPSRWVLDSCEALGGERHLPADADWFTTVASFSQRVTSANFPSTKQEYRLRALAGTGPRDLLSDTLVAGDTAMRLGFALAQGRGRDGLFTRFDGNVSSVADLVPSPTDGRPLSPTQLELWLSCPHAYLMRHVLRAEPVANPEELLEIDPMERGSLVHDVLERWLREHLPGGIPRPDQPWPEAARALMRRLAEEACADAEARGVTGHRLLWQRDRKRILLDLERFVDHDDQRRAALRSTPIDAERPFGIPGSGTPPIDIALPDGRTLRLRGRIDRLDKTEDGALLVTDYKTGRSRPDVTDGHPLGDGTKLQLGIYGLAVRNANEPVRAEYWFASTKGEFKRFGFELTPEVESALGGALAVAVRGIESGAFPLKPPEPGFRLRTECQFCDPDDLGTTDRYSDWERVREAPELHDYVAHIAPELAVDGSAP